MIYSKPAYVDGFYYFLQADYGQGKVALYKYLPEEVLEAVVEFGTDEVDLYNLQIVGEKVHVISQNGEVFKCYYPEKISFPLEGSETVELLTDDRVYSEKWIEEGWDEDRMELIKPERRAELIEDIKERTGLDIIKVEVGGIDMLRDMAVVKVYYRSKHSSSVDDKVKLRRTDFSD